MELLDVMEPWMIPIVVMICVTAIVLITTVGGIIKASIKRKSGGNLSENREFLDALREFKESTDHRLASLEAMAAGNDPEPSPGEKREDKNPKQRSAIEIEMESQRGGESTKEGSKLRNMLNQ